jgi:hypothetical protein
MTSIDTLSVYRPDFPEAFAALDEWRKDATARRNRFLADQPPLSIGVMGQIKVGKSSFLNQLLFHGKPLLPEAATPKTANLTHIRYADTPCFTAYFYSPQSWAVLEDLAGSDAKDIAANAARELVHQAKRDHGDNISSLLARGSVKIQVDDIDTLLGQINDYVGAEGRFTPLVESSELELPLPELMGIEIVDTPGMNDPVVSRTDKTRTYMAQCDVVFFLSHASRLLDENDQQLLAAQLPAKGVKRLILVASQFDAAILDDGYNRASLHECETHLRHRLGDHVRRNLERLAVQREKQGFSDVATILRGIGAPLFASNYAETWANCPTSEWSESQKHVYQELKNLANDEWGGIIPDHSGWQDIGGFAALRAAVDKVKAEKDLVLNEQRTKLEKELTQALVQILANLRDQATNRIAFIQSHDIADLDAHETKANKRMQAIANTLGAYVKAQANAARSESRHIMNDINLAAGRARNLDDRTGYETHRHSRRVSDSEWYKPWTWGRSHIEYYTETITYRYLAVADALENVRLYFEEFGQRLLRLFDKLIAPGTLSTDLRQQLVNVLDTRSDDFDPSEFRALIENTLAGMSWPQLELEAPDTNRAFAGFSGELRNEGDMSALRRQLEQVIGKLQQDFIQNLDLSVQKVCHELDTLAGQLQEALTKSLITDIDRLRIALADKAGQVERLQSLVKEIDSGAYQATEKVRGIIAATGHGGNRSCVEPR